jgi:light-regulated signal transduction histidine kinase (bacteriophytochrome)
MKIKSIKSSLEDYLKIKRVGTTAKISLTAAILIMFLFFCVQSLVVFNVIQPSYTLTLIGYTCSILFLFPFIVFIKKFLDRVNSNEADLIENLIQKNTYLEHAAKILRHDMHSGINTYVPRGVKSLERRLDKETIKRLKLESPLKLIKEGLAHSQQVYRGVLEFTNLVREDVTLQITPVNLKVALEDYLQRTAYSDQVVIDDLPTLFVNEPLFCTAIDNLIRNGLKYNDSDTKWVKIKMIDKDTLAIIDNGRGMSQKDFEKLRLPYSRKTGQKEKGTGLGLNICVAILNEHSFTVSVEELKQGTMIKVNFNDQFYTFGG